MDSFGNLLKKYIQKQGLTIYQVAKDSDMDRSFLQGVLSGKRKMPQIRFESLINASFFTTSQVKNLCKVYYAEKFGKEKISRFSCIEKGTKGGFKEDLRQRFITNTIELLDNTFYSGKADVLSAIFTMLNQQTTEDFYSNFTFQHNEINNMVYNACRAKKIKNFFHYVSNCPENNHQNTVNIETIFFSLHYAEIGYLTYIFPENTANSFMPYYILTDKYFLQYDENFAHAFLISTDLVKKSFILNKIKEIQKNCVTKVFITDTAFEAMRIMHLFACNTKHLNIFGFDNIFCPTYVNAEIVEAIATPVVKNMPNVANQLISHYQLLLGEGTTSNINKIVITTEALERFVKTGRIDNFPLEYATPVPKNMRVEMLKSMINNKQEWQLSMPNVYHSDYNFAFQINNNNLMFSTCEDIDAPGAYNGKVIYSTDHEKVVEDFADFFEYFSCSEKVYSNSTSRKLIQAYIDELETK